MKVWARAAAAGAARARAYTCCRVRPSAAAHAFAPLQSADVCLHILLPAPAQDPRFMYLSLDEACTHVDASAFRLVAGIYSRQGTRLLATAVSPPIRCGQGLGSRPALHCAALQTSA